MIKKDGLYYPSEDFKEKAHVNNEEIYVRANEDPISFWEENAKEVVWKEKWEKAFSHNPPYFSWFSGGKINITESVLDKNKDNEKMAIIFCPNSPDEKELEISYKDLYKQVNKFANGLKKMGVKKGDPVGIYMPMIPETVIALLSCARIGAMHTVVFSAFSPSALRVRLQDTGAKVLITADGFKRAHEVVSLKNNVDEGIKETFVEKVILVKRGCQEINFTEKDVWWDDVVEGESEECVAEAMDSEDPLFILYTSGSTGKPKGVLHTCGGYTVQAKTTGKLIFDIKKEDVFWSTADIGWITGHTYTIYSPLLNGATTLIFEGVPNWPNHDRFAEIIEKHNVTIFYTAPTAIRLFKMQLGTVEKELKSLRLLGSVGEPIDEDTWEWYYREVGKERCPVVDTWWQTETGGILITSLPGVGPFKPTFSGRTFPGVNFDIYKQEEGDLKEGESGDLVILPPFSPGMLRGVYNNDEKYRSTYFADYGEEVYYTSDKAYRDKDGLIRIVGRADDVIKVAGHRLSTGEMENIVAKNKDVAECAVVGVHDDLRGEVPVVFAVVTSEREGIDEEVKKALWDEIGPIAMVKSIYLVKDLPKTRSGKIMRRIMKKIFANEELGDLSTLANPESVEGLKEVIKNQT